MSGVSSIVDAGTVSTMEETDKKCPSCFGVMDFDPETGGLSCPTIPIKAEFIGLW